MFLPSCQVLLNYSRLTFNAVVNPSVPDIRKCQRENKGRQPNVSDVNMSVAVTSSCYNTTIDASYCGKTIKECLSTDWKKGNQK